jgi:hypothetical protein
MTREPEPVLLATTDCVALLPTEAVTETELGVTESFAAESGDDAFAVVDTPPTHPANWRDTATRLSVNTRSEPRFECEKFNADLPYFDLFTTIFFTTSSRPGASRP